MATGALNPEALGKYMGNLYITPEGGVRTDMGAVRALIANIDNTNVTDILSDNRGSLIKFSDLQANITVTLLETQSRDKLNLLFNTTSSTVAGTPTAVTDEALGTGWTVGTPIKLANKNGDNTVVTSIDIKADAVSLVDGTDFDVYVGDGNNGDLGYTYIVPLTSQTGVLTADYSYTPNDTEIATIDVGTNVLKNFLVEIVATEDTRERIITLSSATLNATYALGFVDVVENGDISESPVTFEANRGSVFTYSDQILD